MKSTLTILIIQFIVIAVLIAGTYYFYNNNTSLLYELTKKEMSIQQSPQEEFRRMALESEVSGRQEDIEKMKEFLVDRSELVQVINEIESIAKDYNLEIRIPNISQRMVTKDAGPEEVVMGDTEDLVLDVVSLGDQKDIILFLHQLEHSPYLMRLQSWKVSKTTQSSANRESIAIAPDSESSVLPQVQSEAKVIVTVWRDDANVR